jgi:uncharacterized protein (UPF0335 family)
MGRPRGSKNKSAFDDGGDDAPPRNTVSGTELLAYIERIEYCNEQQTDISADRQQVFKELKQAGYDRDTVRALVARRKLSLEQREAADAYMDQYRSALGDFASTPLGEAAVEQHMTI